MVSNIFGFPREWTKCENAYFEGNKAFIIITNMIKIMVDLQIMSP